MRYLIPLNFVTLVIFLFLCANTVFAAKGNNLGTLPTEKEVAVPVKPVEEEEVTPPTKPNAFSTLWNSTRTLETAAYKVIIPSAWEKFPNMSPGVEQNFSIKNLPSNYNGSVVLTSFLVTKQADTSLDEVVSLVKKGLKNATIKQYSYKANNWHGAVIESFQPNFLNGRDSKRYDLVLFSKQKNTPYTFSFIVLLKDANNDFAQKYNLEEYTQQIFNHIWLNE